MPGHSSLSIANEFLRRAYDERRELTHMQLQKLVYLAHGWTLAVTGKDLIEEEIEAWEYGPVIRRLYDALRRYGSQAVTQLIRWGDDLPYPSGNYGEAKAELSNDEQALVDKVWETYRGYKAFQLSALTHADRTPWTNIYKPGQNKVIGPKDIRSYFVTLAERGA